MGHRLPSAVPYSPMPEHLEVLRVPGGCRVRIGQRGSETDTMHRHLRDARDLGWRLDVEQVYHGRCEIDRMTELTPDLPGRSELCGPLNYQRVSDAAAVSILLVPLERSVPRLRPSPGYVRVAVGSADVVEPRDCVVEILAHAVEITHLVQHAERTALLAGAVVRHHDEQRVVEQIEFL